MTTLDRFRSATGARSLAIVKRKPGNYLGAYISRTPFTARERPVVELDVMMMPGGHGALMFPINLAFHVVTLNGTARDPLLGTATGVVDDGKWHHVRFDLAKMMASAGMDAGVTIPYIATRRTDASGIDSWTFIDNFQLHSGRSRKIRLMWKPAAGGRVEGYSFALDRDARTEPDAKPEGAATSRIYENLEPGKWYFHVRAVDDEGRWGDTAHFEIEVRK